MDKLERGLLAKTLRGVILHDIEPHGVDAFVTCLVCGASEYGVRDDKHEPGCAGIALIKSLERSADDDE